MTWPLVLAPGAQVPEDLGDPLMTAAILWWNAHQLPFTDTWWNGAFYFPGTGNLALSDHRVGLGLLASPWIWLGASPLTAYGITFLLTFWLSAVAAYALVALLTANRGAAFIAGLVFGFNPFRAGHLAHLELLAAFWLPVILIALHQWLATRRKRWLLALSVSLLLQALTSGYYFFFMAVFVGLWLVWYARGLPHREYAVLGVVLAAPLVAISPVLARYRQIHETLGLSRPLEEIKRFSADVVGLLTASDRLALWDAPDAWRRSEGELMPGLVAVVLVVIAAVTVPHRAVHLPTARMLAWLRTALVVAAIIEIGVALLPVLVGPVSYDLAGINVSMRSPDKPLSVAALCIIAWLVTSQRFMAAFAARSAFAFYCLAAGVMWLLALGPEGRFLGQPVLYKPPYAWLMQLPGFDESFRAPARFGMLAALALCVAAGLAVARLTPRFAHRTRVVAMTAIVAAILAESWIRPFPFTPAPRRLELPPGVPESAAVLELPTGVYEDALAMFHSTEHRRRTVNGISGYTPAHYQILAAAVAEGDAGILAALRRHADIVVLSRRDWADATERASRFRAGAEAVPLASTGAHHVTLYKMLPAQASDAGAQAIRPTAIATEPPASSTQELVDGDPRTAWSSGAQTGTEMITATLSAPQEIVGVEIILGPHVRAFGRGLAAEISHDGRHWETVATANGAEAAYEAALRDARGIPVAIRFAPRRAAQVRIRQTGQSRAHWAVAELHVLVRRVG